MLGKCFNITGICSSESFFSCFVLLWNGARETATGISLLGFCITFTADLCNFAILHCRLAGAEGSRLSGMFSKELWSVPACTWHPSKVHTVPMRFLQQCRMILFFLSLILFHYCHWCWGQWVSFLQQFLCCFTVIWFWGDSSCLGARVLSRLMLHIFSSVSSAVTKVIQFG